MSYYALYTPSSKEETNYFPYLSDYINEYRLAFIVYGERKDIEEFYEGKDYRLEPIEIVNKDGKLVNCKQKLPPGDLYKILCFHGLRANYILADNVNEAEEAYKRYCYSNLKKPIEKDLHTRELVKPEKVVQCIRKDGIVNIIV